MQFISILVAVGIFVIALIRMSSGSYLTPPPDEEFEEDPQRLFDYWDMRMSPEEYRLAIDSAGYIEYPYDKSKSGTWVPLGPFGKLSNINGRVGRIYIRPKGDGTHDIYVGANGGGLWRSSTSNIDWDCIGETLENQSVRGFAVNPLNPDNIVVGTGEYPRYGGSGIYYTTNGGTNWNRVSPPVSGIGHFYCMYYLYDDDASIMLAACNKGVLRSTNGGLNWTVVLDRAATDLAINPNHRDSVYACSHHGNRGVHISTDGGITWDILDQNGAPTGPNSADFERGSLAICREFPENIALILSNGSTNGLKGVYKSTDAGNSWTNITGDLGNFGGNQLFHAQAIAFHPDDPQKIYIGAQTIGMTTDGGTTWLKGPTETNIPRGMADFTHLYFADSDVDTLWMSNDGGIFAHVFATHTTIPYHGESGNPAKGLNCLQIDFIDAERGFMATGLQDNGIIITTDGGSTWNRPSTGDGGDNEITDNASMEWWYVSGVGGGSEPGCDTMAWPMYYRRPGESRNCVPGVIGYMPKYFYDKYIGKIYTYDANNIYSSPVPRTGTPGWVVETANIILPKSNRGIHGDYVDGKTLFITPWNDPYIKIFKKGTGGWSSSTHYFTTEFPNACQAITVTASPQNTHECWVGFHDGANTGGPRVIYTPDMFLSQESITDGTILQYVKTVREVVVTPFNEEQIFVATNIGVYWTTNGGVVWERLGSGLPYVDCHDMRYLIDTTHSGNDQLVVATYGRGVWKCSIAGPPIVFVDKDYSGQRQDGTLEYPYINLSYAISVAPNNSVIAIHGDSYPKPTPQIVEGKHLRFESYASSALIGAGK